MIKFHLGSPVLLFALLAVRLVVGAEWKFPCPTNEIARCTAHRVSAAIHIDGRLDEVAWQRSPPSPRFTDILTGRDVIHDTRASVLWDEENLYIAFRLEEPLVHARFTTNNSPIYYDNDVEVFIAGRDPTTNLRSMLSARPTKCSSFGRTLTSVEGSGSRPSLSVRG